MRRGPPWVLIILLAVVGGCCATSLIYYAIWGRHPPAATEVTPTPTVFYYPSPTARPRPTPTPTPALALTFTKALASGHITATAQGAGLEAVRIAMRRLSDVNMAISIPIGTFFVNRGDAQDMVAVSPTTVLEDGDPVTRQETVRALTDLHAADVFTQTLKSPDLNLRLDSVQTLAEIGEKRAVPSVIEALDDQDPRVRAAAAVCLATLADPRAITALNARLEREEDAAVIEAIRSALEAFQQP